MKKIILFLFTFLFIYNVNALDYNVTNSITSPVAPSNDGTYTGEEQNGATSSWRVNTRYQGTLQRIRFNIPKPSSIEGDCYWSNMTYKVTMNMATEDWRNRFGSVSVTSAGSSNFSNGKVTFVSMKKIYFTFKIPSSDTNCYDYVYINLGSSATFTPFTGDTNWNLQSIILTDELSSGSSGGGSSGTTPTPTPDNTDKIIENASQNTQDIINNNNSNTSDIIENNNNNTQDIINNQKDLLGQCYTNLLNPNNFVNSSGYIGYLVQLEEGEVYTLKSYNGNFGYKIGADLYGYTDVEHWSLDNSSYTFTYHKNSNNTGSSYAFLFTTEPVNINNSMFVLVKGNYSGDFIPYTSEKCFSKLDDTNNSINNVNDTLNNSNVENGVGSDFFDDFSSQDFGLSSIITLPLTTIQSLTSKSCVSLSVPIPFTNRNISLPCMTQIYGAYIPTIFNLWRVVSFGIIAYFIAIDIFHMVKGFKDPESDKVEVLDL